MVYNVESLLLSYQAGIKRRRGQAADYCVIAQVRKMFSEEDGILFFFAEDTVGRCAAAFPSAVRVLYSRQRKVD